MRPSHPLPEGKDGYMVRAFGGDVFALKSKLATGVNPDAKNDNGMTVLMLVVGNLHLPFATKTNIIDTLVEHGSNLDLISPEMAALHYAAFAGSGDVVTYLIQCGANVNVQSVDGHTPLSYAAAYGQHKVVDILLSSGADVNATTQDGVTPLMQAANKGYHSAAQLLLRQDASCDLQDDDGNTALIIAAIKGHLELVELLLNHGANPDIDNYQGLTALTAATLVKNRLVAKRLQTVTTPASQSNFDSVPNKPALTSNRRQLVRSKPVQLSSEAILNDLDTLIGLQQVKAEVTQLTNFLRFQRMRKEKGLSVPNQSLHMVFTGNPGTGKTTIARLIAQIYRSMGILSKGQFVETDRAGLVGGYLGQTAIKTQEIIESALGGVLFIDEAYSLTDSTHGHDMYGQEAVATLLKQMEDHRDDLIVIVAGYTEPMQKFIRSNPGLQSRFNKFLHFDDYAPSELTEIFRHFATQGDYKLHPATELKLQNVFADLYAQRDETFGNARLARNLFEKSINAHANRMVMGGALDEESLVTLYPEDVPNS
ncbi:MAG: ankyrin repeat domain-containing protein [Janthinobacterium lividum]